MSAGLIHDVMGYTSTFTIHANSLSKDDPLREIFLESNKQIENTLNILKTKEKKKFPISNSIDSINKLLKYKSLRKNIKIVILKNNIENIFLYGNEFYFYQIIINIISNAIDSYNNSSSNKKYHKENEKTVTVSLGKNEDENKLIINITDFGCGISKNTIKKISRYFYTEKQNGTGLGLAVAYRLIKKEYKGKISVFSTKNIGTTFKLEIPITQNK